MLVLVLVLLSLAASSLRLPRPAAARFASCKGQRDVRRREGAAPQGRRTSAHAVLVLVLSTAPTTASTQPAREPRSRAPVRRCLHRTTIVVVVAAVVVVVVVVVVVDVVVAASPPSPSLPLCRSLPSLPALPPGRPRDK